MSDINDKYILDFNQVYHLGNLAGKPSPRYSLEGHCLSVSLCPNEWRMIAQLGDLDCHILSKKNSQFLDAHAFTNIESNRTQILSWAERQGLITKNKLYQIEWYDEEYNQTRTMLLDSYDEAVIEADGYGVEIVPTTGWIANQMLIQHTNQIKIEPNLVEDMVLICFGEKMGLDGIWWTDFFYPHSLGAPRGGIYPNKLSRWTVRRI